MNRKLIFIFTLLLTLFLGMIYAYFAFYTPVNQAVEQAKQQINAEEELISALEETAFSTDDTQLLNTESLQKKMPVKLMDDKLLLDLEKAELLSGSLITSIEFMESAILNNEESADSEANISENDESEEQGLESTVEGLSDYGNGEIGTDEETVLLEPEVLPEGVHSSYIHITAQADNYEEVESFIETLEGQMRLLIIKELYFTGPEEAEKIEGTETPIEFTLIVAAYYMPGLLDLLEGVPVIDTPYPANKENPIITIEE